VGGEEERGGGKSGREIEEKKVEGEGRKRGGDEEEGIKYGKVIKKIWKTER
jgi:hypothetical protein